MTTFRYKGQTAGGAKVSGVLRAYDEFEAADKLRESVAIITKLEAVPEKKESVLSRPVAFRVKEKELALLCSQFAIILASGLSVERCVSMVAAQTKNKYLRRMLDKVSEEVGAGYSLAQSFENNAPYLPKTFTETLRAGEQSGTLESCFQRLHAYYDRSAKTRAKIVSTLTYPVMVIIVAIVVFVIIIAVAVPAFTDAFTDLGSGSLPGVTRALMAVSAFFTKWWWLVLGVLEKVKQKMPCFFNKLFCVILYILGSAKRPPAKVPPVAYALSCYFRAIFVCYACVFLLNMNGREQHALRRHPLGQRRVRTAPA